MKGSKKIRFILVALPAMLALLGCRGGYSFTGTSISPEVKTISVDFFQNMAPIVMPTLSNDFTEALKEKFRRQTRLSFVNANGHLHFEGEITGYDVMSKAIQANETAALSTLTITVKVRFTNEIDEKQNFDRQFSANQDFPGSQTLESVQGSLIPQIIETLTENIFNAAVANW